ncbi:hypothetical protein [Pseudomonas tolaasii]|uniref:hypothetical protein n=1 Tax=Pseudomonas tolaasii TaxID=29442 RepID=UPI001C57AF8D|nr:hypothetical protein [Pseudomonas tolaasii]MBW1247927.1 hypothetical protein [Pseudomonas tolaasii]MBW4792837.1 hypothetical protein [Pseudomonas tolaasii]
MPVSGISASRTFNQKDFIDPQASHTPASQSAARVRRSTAQDASNQEKRSGWTFLPQSSRRNSLAPLGDRELQDAMRGAALGGTADKRVQVPDRSSIYPVFDAYRSAINSPEARAWFARQGMDMSTVVVKPGSVSGNVTRDGVTRLETFTATDASGWWRISPRVNATAAALDVEGKGLPYLSDDSDVFSRNMILRWYGVKPPTHDGDLGRVRNELGISDWFTLPANTKAELAKRIETARTAVDSIDQRSILATQLEALLGSKPDDEVLVLSGVMVPIGSTSALASGGATEASLSAVLQSLGLPLPETAAQLRNVLRWLHAGLPPAPALGNYAQLISNPWAPGVLSNADKAYLAGLTQVDPNHKNPSRDLFSGGILDSKTPEELRDRAEFFISQALSRARPQAVWEHIALNRHFRGASGTTGYSSQELMQWAIAAILLQIDPEAPGTPGTVAGYDVYSPANTGRSLAQVREDIEAHLRRKLGNDAKAAPLVAHLFLASAAPEFLVRGVPANLRIGSREWADLRLGVTFAERQGGAGCSRGMRYAQVMALSRLDARNPQEAALLDNYGVNVLLDWGLMQGLYTKPAGGLYTPQQHQQAAGAFDAQRRDLIQALSAFKAPLPTRRDLATDYLQTVFPDLNIAQLQALRVSIADPDERRNMKLSEPRTRSLIETYMSGDLTAGRWMLLAPGEQVPQPPAPKTPYGAKPKLSRSDQAAVDQNVKALNARIARLPDVQALLAGKVDTYLANLKQGLSTTTRQLFANLPLEDRQALEWGDVELFALRSEVDNVPTVEQTGQQVEERKGRKGTLVRSEYKGIVRYFEVFPDKMLIVKREDLPATLKLGGTLEDGLTTYGRWAPSVTQLQKGSQEPFDFTAYSADSVPRPGVKSDGVIIEKLGATLAGVAPVQQGDASALVPDSFSSERSVAIVDRIMQGNFVHHRDTVLAASRGALGLEQQREVLRRNDGILLGMIPFVGAIMELAKGNIVEGTRGLIIDTVGAFVGGAGSGVSTLLKSTKVVAPFGSKVFRVLEKGVAAVSGFLNPLDGSADLLALGAKGVFVVPKLLSKTPRSSVLTALGGVEEKLRTYLGVEAGLKQINADVGGQQSRGTFSGLINGIGVNALHVEGQWYATHPETGLPVGTPLEGVRELVTAAA